VNHSEIRTPKSAIETGFIVKKILIVEDEEKSLYLARFILEKEGYEVIEARDGLEALDKTFEENPDLILMDMQLPKLDGYEATKAIRNLECGLRNKIEEGPYSKSEIRNLKSKIKNVPIIALTAYAMKGDREKTLEAGCSGYIEKPIDPASFVEDLKKYLY